MYPPNTLNDYYLRQPYQQQFNFPPQQPQIRANWVSSIDEAKASQIDFVSTNLFLDTANGKIYLKRIGDNGKPMFLSYIIEEEVQKDPLAEINYRLTKIEQAIGGRNVQSVPNDASVQQSATNAYPATTKPNERYDETKSAGLPENAGNDKWQKRR